MIKPHKYLNLNLSVLNIGSIILSLLKQEKIMKYDHLLEKLIDNKGEDVKDIFLPTLNFLFLVGKIQYYQKTDSFALIQ